MSATLARISTIKKIILWSIVVGGIIALFIPTLVHGAPQPLDVCTGANNNCLNGTAALSTGTDGQSIAKVIISIARLLTYISAAIAILILVVSGVRMISSNGDQKAYGDSLKAIQYSILGLVIAVVAYSIISILSGVITGITLG